MMACLRWEGCECEVCPLEQDQRCGGCLYYDLERVECTTCIRYGDDCCGRREG